MYACTCHTNAKTFTCEHSLGVAIMRSILTPPPGTTHTLLGRKLRRGRKPAVGAAWEYLPFDLHAPVLHPQQDPEVLAGRQDHNQLILRLKTRNT